MLIPYLTSGGNEYQWFKSYTETAIDILLSRNIEISKTGSKGGYASVFQPFETEPPRMEYLMACGTFPFDRYGRYFYNTFEKPTRLNDHIPEGHVTSGQSANPDQMEFDGAVYFADLKRIFSFSGLEPQFDLFLSIMNGSFNRYLIANKIDQSITLADVPAIFCAKLELIPATHDIQQQMIYTVEHVVAKEISLQNRR